MAGTAQENTLATIANESKPQLQLGGTPAVAVILSVHKPEPILLRRHIESLLAQDGVTLRIFAAVDGDETLNDHQTRALLDRAAISVLPSPEPLGIRDSFIRGLGSALAAANSGEMLYAFADQDDHWHPRKLEISARFLAAKTAMLVHCDAAVVGDDGVVIAASLHRYEARQAAQSLFDHLLINSVTGMTSLFTAEAARLAVRLAAGLPSTILHDHLTAIAAAALGRTCWIDEPLVDYVQHGSNSLGAVARPTRSWRSRAISLADLSRYRQTSAAIFEDRRGIVINLQREGVKLGPLREMFLADGNPGRWRLSRLYASAAADLLRRKQARRAVLCLRLMDAALMKCNARHVQ